MYEDEEIVDVSDAADDGTTADDVRLRSMNSAADRSPSASAYVSHSTPV